MHTWIVHRRRRKENQKSWSASQIISTNTIPRSTSKVDVSGVIAESIR